MLSFKFIMNMKIVTKYLLILVKLKKDTLKNFAV